MLKGIKICGISDLDTLNYLINHRYPPNFIGFISNYKKSKRYVTFEKLRVLTSVEKKNINFVSVLVNPNDEILEEMKGLNFDYYQLYDVEPTKTKMIKEKYGVKIITALTIKKKKDVNKYKNYLWTCYVSLFYFIIGFIYIVEKNSQMHAFFTIIISLMLISLWVF